MKNILVFIFLLMFFPSIVLAKEMIATETATVKVVYELPYPGILPDHPLYILKQARDWVMDKLIVDPLKKAEFYILQADKRLNSGLMLSAKGNQILSEQVISKGEKYMNNALTLLMTRKAQGEDIPNALIDKLGNALAKHKELLLEEIARAGDATKAGLTGSLELVNRLIDDLATLRK